jgi:hypothetical protein
MTRRSPLSLRFTVFACLAAAAWADPLKETGVNLIVNDVKLVELRTDERPAVVKNVINNDLGVLTGNGAATQSFNQRPNF